MSSGKRNKSRLNNLLIARTLTTVGVIGISLGATLLLAVLAPVIREELGYNVKQVLPTKKTITPVDTGFGIVIPNIEANARVIADVDPFDSREYQIALTRGVAHAKGSAKPGALGNIFLFSHSSVNFYEAARYNSVFYLLSKLEMGDTVNLYYTGTPYHYTITDKKIVAPTAVSYLEPSRQKEETLTLMTCWPPGTTYKRLMIIAKRTP